MNIIDIIALIPILYFVVMGFRKGILKEAFGIAALLLGIVVTLKFSHLALQNLTDVKEVNSAILPIVVYAIVFVAVFALVLLIGRFIEKLLKAAQLNFANRFAGGIIGLIKAFFLLSLFIWIADMAAFFDDVVKSESFAYKYIKELTPKAISLIGEIIPSLQELIANIEAYFDQIADNIDRLN
jgi:membrane protein required for colicin V production